ncbi:MAG: winged helix-turn-helix domain-containing protein [Myxococcota bacterium]
MATLALGTRTVDLWTGDLSDGGRLRPLELRLLRTLAEAGGPVAREQLLTDVFHYAPGTSTRALSSTVYRLRQAVEPDPGQPRFVLAERGAYRLAATLALAPEPQPAAFDAFVGRRALLEALAHARAPLVTLVGPGGSGKSRLAAEHLAAASEPGTLAVPLDESGLIGAFARAWGERRAPDDVAELAARLAVSGLARVVLDDAEGQLDAVRQLVAELRRVGAGLRLLVTSREPLAVAGERRLDVGPMAPEEAQALLRTRAAEGGAEVSDALAAEIVGLVDRLPLAIELAAGRIAWSSAEAVRDQLLVDVDLTSDRADRPGRHQSLDAVLEGTWRRLDSGERFAVGQLSVPRAPSGSASPRRRSATTWTLPRC